jgi:hypothetical protein
MPPGPALPSVDADGNETAGLALPDVTVPTGTAMGWSVRSEFGGGTNAASGGAPPFGGGFGNGRNDEAAPEGLSPKVLEPCRRQLGVAHRVLNVSVPEIGLQRLGVVAGIGQRIATGMPQHVGMNPELEARLDTGPLYHLGETRRAERSATFRQEYELGLRRLAL